MHFCLAAESSAVDAITFVVDATVDYAVSVAASTDGYSPSVYSKSTVQPVYSIAFTPCAFAWCT